MSEAAMPLTQHEVVLADRYRASRSDRELVLEAPPEAVAPALLHSDLSQSSTEYLLHVIVLVRAPAGHLEVAVSPFDGGLEMSGGHAVEGPTSPTGASTPRRTALSVESAAAPKRADAVLNRVVSTISTAMTDHQF